MKYFSRIIFLLAIYVGHPSTSHAQKRVALVIGNSAYMHTAPLANPKNDALDTSIVLKSFGFHVIDGFDLSKIAMDRILRDFADSLPDANLGLFFYAGHGVQVSGENYLVPIDARLETASALEFEAVRLQIVQRIMEASSATNVLFIDACRDNPLTRNLARALGTRSAGIGKGLAPLEAGAGTLISFSTQPGNVALDGADRNSPFAAALIHHLALSNDDLSNILIAVRNTVMARTGNRQIPWEHSSLRARVFLNEPAPSILNPSSVATSEAAEAWAAIKTSNDRALLSAYVAKYPQTIFADLARSRIKELQGSLSSNESSVAISNYMVTRNGPGCTPAKYSFSIKLSQGMVTGYAGAGQVTGVILSDGKFNFLHPSTFGGNVKYEGVLKGDTGQGFFYFNFNCRGTFTVTRG